MSINGYKGLLRIGNWDWSLTKLIWEGQNLLAEIHFLGWDFKGQINSLGGILGKGILLLED